MKFQLALLAVEDVAVSKKFYKELFDQEVVLDFGKNVMFSGGFAIQEDFSWLTGIDSDAIVKKSNTMELVFDVEDIDAFIKKLDDYGGVEYVHLVREYEWKQRVVRIYDPDYHIIEIGESMESVARRFLAKGYSVEETAKLIQHPIEFVQMCC